MVEDVYQLLDALGEMSSFEEIESLAVVSVKHGHNFLMGLRLTHLFLHLIRL